MSAANIERNLLNNMVEKTGKTLENWMQVIKESSETKQNGIIKWLKTNEGLNHLISSNLAGIYLNQGEPVHSDFEGLFRSLFESKEQMKPLYEALINKITSNLPNFEIVPRKSYVQMDAKRTFAVLRINKSNVRLGLDLGDETFSQFITKSKSLGAMPRFSHMIEFKTENDVDGDFIAPLIRSLERNN